MKKFVLAAVAAMSIGMGVAAAAPIHNNNGWSHLPSSEYTYSPANG